MPDSFGNILKRKNCNKILIKSFFLKEGFLALWRDIVLRKKKFKMRV